MKTLTRIIYHYQNGCNEMQIKQNLQLEGFTNNQIKLGFEKFNKFETVKEVMNYKI